MTALTYDISIFGIDFTGAQTPGTADNLTAMHIHAAPVGVNGPVVFGFLNPNSDVNPPDLVITPFVGMVGGRVTGKWDLPEGAGGQTLATQLGNLFNSGLYANFHTMAFPGGEIRGQILPTPEPGTLTLFALGAAGLALAAWRRRARK
jgi:hypothetical protein